MFCFREGRESGCYKKGQEVGELWEEGAGGRK